MEKQIREYMVRCREAGKSATVPGVCDALDLPTNIDNLRAVRGILRHLNRTGFVTMIYAHRCSEDNRYIAS